MILKKYLSTVVLSILLYLITINAEQLNLLSDNIVLDFPNRPAYHFTKGFAYNVHIKE